MGGGAREVKKSGHLPEGKMLPFDFRLDPGAESGLDVGNRKSRRRGNFETMQLGKASDGPVCGFRRGLEQGGDLSPVLDPALPAVDRADRPEDVGAGGEPLLDKDAGDARRFLSVGERRVEGDEAGHAAHSPSRCALASRVASSTTAIAWCDTASGRSTPLSRVAIPSRIWPPTASSSAAAWPRRPRRHAVQASIPTAAATPQASQRWMNCTSTGLS